MVRHLIRATGHEVVNVDSMTYAASADALEEAGADPRLVEIVDVLETPLSYSTSASLKVSVKAAGPLALIGSPAPLALHSPKDAS